MRKIGFGIVGLGVIAETHAKALSDAEGCELRGAFDIVPERAEAFGKKHGTRYFTDLDQMLSDPDIDVVSITTPSGLHLEPALAAIEKGKHVLIEKPIEITGERADAISKAAREKGVKVSCLFQSRFHGAARAIKDAIDRGRFGRIVLADAYIKWYRSQEYYDSGAWRGTWKIDGGGALMNQGIHAIDLLQWFAGPVQEVGAFTDTLAHERIEVEDTGAVVLRFRSGALGVIEGTTGTYPGSLKKIEIRGTEGTAVLEEDSITMWDFRTRLEEDDEILARYSSSSSAGGAADPKAISTHGHQMEFEDFAKAIIEDRDPFITAEDAAASVKIINAAYESGRTGRFVSL